MAYSPTSRTRACSSCRSRASTSNNKGAARRPWIADKGGKTWFFLLCGYQSKINKLIFLVF
ncbi:hypothetical protein EGY12_08205 [Serratia sp. FDAARGOS_506]|nr:hypothetical protein EGY12_08205 [Serratia sp. FDAARGOS_506]